MEGYINMSYVNHMLERRIF